MPEGAVILSLQTQKDIPSIWALVDDKNKLVERKFLMYGTGEVMIDHRETDIYIGTFLVTCDSFVFHLFERKD